MHIEERQIELHRKKQREREKCVDAQNGMAHENSCASLMYLLKCLRYLLHVCASVILRTLWDFEPRRLSSKLSSTLTKGQLGRDSVALCSVGNTVHGFDSRGQHCTQPGCSVFSCC
jgi:hypothetical protein